jgi:stage II sporulation protein D
MRKLLRRIVTLLLCAALIVIAVPADAKYTPPTTTVRIGLQYGSSAAPALYLQSVSGLGDGFRFGYYNGDREFVSVGSASNITLAVLKDVNMYGSDGSYSTSSSGSTTTVGCVHIRLDREYSSYSAARAAADSYTSVDAFVKLDHGKYYVCIGDYTSSSAARSAASSLGISSYSANSGTVYTVTLVERYTGKILFEFDWGDTYYMGVVPYTNSGSKPQTWHSGYRYYGGFQFGRPTGGDLYCINYVNIEDYVKGVLPYEVSPSWPREALKAQAVCARTYIMSHLNSHRSSGFDLCTGQHCQVYKGTGNANSNSDAAVDETAGQYLTYKGQLCETYFFSHDGGATENSENVWSGKLDYLRGVIDPYEEAAADLISNYRWSETFTGSELASKLRNAGYSCSTIVNFYVSEFTPTGYVLKMTFVDSNGKTITVSKSSCRSVLGLRSQHFKVYNRTSSGDLVEMSIGSGSSIYVNSGGTLDGSLSGSYAVGGSGTVSAIGSDTAYAITGSGEIERVTGGGTSTATPKASTSTFVVSGSGWGHGIGLSQWGAYAMARYYGKTYDEILRFYYTGTTVE